MNIYKSTHNPATTTTSTVQANSTTVHAVSYRHSPPPQTFRRPHQPAQTTPTSANRYLLSPGDIQNSNTFPLIVDDNVVVYMQLPSHTSEFSFKFDASERRRTAHLLERHHSLANNILVPAATSSSLVAGQHLPVFAASEETNPKTIFRHDILQDNRPQEIDPILTLINSEPNHQFNTATDRPVAGAHRRRHRSEKPHQQLDSSATPMAPPLLHSAMSLPITTATTTTKSKLEDKRNQLSRRDKPVKQSSHEDIISRSVSSQRRAPLSPDAKSLNVVDKKIAPARQVAENKNVRRSNSTMGSRKSIQSENHPDAREEDGENAEKRLRQPKNSHERQHVSRSNSSVALPLPRSDTPESTTTAVALQLLQAAGIDTGLVEEALAKTAQRSLSSSSHRARTKNENSQREKSEEEKTRAKLNASRRTRSETLEANEQKIVTEPTLSPNKPTPERVLHQHSTDARVPLIAPSTRRSSGQRQSSTHPPKSEHVDESDVQPPPHKQFVRSQSRASSRSGTHATIQEDEDSGNKHVRKRTNSRSRRENKLEKSDATIPTPKPRRSSSTTTAERVENVPAKTTKSVPITKEAANSAAFTEHKTSLAKRTNSASVEDFTPASPTKSHKKYSNVSKKSSSDDDDNFASGEESVKSPTQSEQLRPGASAQNAQQLTEILQQLEQQGLITIADRGTKSQAAKNSNKQNTRKKTSTTSTQSSSSTTARQLTRQASLGSNERALQEESEEESSGSENAPLPPRRDSREKSASSKQSGTPVGEKHLADKTKPSKSSKSRHSLMQEGAEWQAYMTSENQTLSQAVKLLEQLVQQKLPNSQNISKQHATVEQLQQLLEHLSVRQTSKAKSDNQFGLEQILNALYQQHSPSMDDSDRNEAYKSDEASSEDGKRSENGENLIIKKAPKNYARENTPEKIDKDCKSSTTTRNLSPNRERNSLKKVQENLHNNDEEMEKSQSRILDSKTKDDAYAKRIAELKQEYAALTATSTRKSRARPIPGVIKDSPSVTAFERDFQASPPPDTPQLPPVNLIHAHCFTEYLSSKLDRELRDAEECQKRVRSNPVPAHVKLPLFEIMQQNELQRKAARRDQSVEMLKIIEPFNFVVQPTPPPTEETASPSDEKITSNNAYHHHHGTANGDEQQQQVCPRAARVMPATPPAFRARPVPHNLLNSRPHVVREQRRRDEQERDRTARMEQLKRESSLPPNMERRGQAYFYGKTHTKNHLEIVAAPKHQPEIHASVPDFGELHRHEDAKIEERKKAAAIRSTIPQPFALATERRAKEKQNLHDDNNAARANPIKSQTNNQRKQHATANMRRTGSSATSLNTLAYNNTTRQISNFANGLTAAIIPRETWATRMRRAHSHKRMLQSLRGDVETRMRELTTKEKQVLMRLKMHNKLETANSNLDYQMSLNVDRAEKMRNIIRMRDDAYHKQLAQIQQKVDETRPFLFERQGQKTPQTQKQLLEKVFSKQPQQPDSRTLELLSRNAAPENNNLHRSDFSKNNADSSLESARSFVDSMNVKHGFLSAPDAAVNAHNKQNYRSSRKFSREEIAYDGKMSQAKPTRSKQEERQDSIEMTANEQIASSDDEELESGTLIDNDDDEVTDVSRSDVEY